VCSSASHAFATDGTAIPEAGNAGNRATPTSS
jgi:hypothetical protein